MELENEKNIKSLLSEKDFKDYYFSSGKNKKEFSNIWYQDLVNMKNNIEKIYELHQPGFLGAWYYVIDKQNNNYTVKHSINDVNTSFMMSTFLHDNQLECKRVNETMLFGLNKDKSMQEPDLEKD